MLEVTTGLTVYHMVRPFFQPLIGAFHGWFATRMVVVMLFRPYKAYYWPGTQQRLPFTPGIFPSRKKALAENIARTVTETLLTPQDIQTQTDKFITETNLVQVVSVLLDTMLDSFSYADKIHRLAEEFKKIIPDLLNTSATALLNRLTEEDSRQLAKLTDYLVQDILLNIQISHSGAKELVDYIFRSVLSTPNIRQTLYTVLTPQRAVSVQKILREKTTGALKFVLSLVNIEGMFLNLKEYLHSEPQKSEKLIEELIAQLQIKEDLTEKVASLDFKKLSFEDISLLKENLRKGLRQQLIEHRHSLDRALVHLDSVIGESLNQKIRDFTPSQIKPELLDWVKNEVGGFFYRYLKTDLSRLIKRGIAVLKPGEMITTKIEAYSSADVEELILGIMRRELANLEILGLGIGLVLGISALGVEYFLPLH